MTSGSGCAVLPNAGNLRSILEEDKVAREVVFGLLRKLERK